MRIRKLFFLICVSVFLAADIHAASGVTFIVTWSPISDPTVSEVLVYRSIDISGDFVQIAAVPVSQTQYTDASEIEDGVRYYYKVRSRNTLGSVSGFSQAVSAERISPDCPEETKDECRIVSVVAAGAGAWQVEWSTADPTAGMLEYWKMGDPGYTTSDPEQAVSTSHSAVLAGLEDNSIYFVRAVAFDESRTSLTISHDFAFATSTGEETLQFVLEPASLTVDEGSSAGFTVRLSAAPSADVGVSVSRSSGDADITVASGSSLVFTPSDWYTPQAVTIEAAEDADEDDGEALFVINWTYGPEVAVSMMTVTEKDNDLGPSMASAVISIYPIPFQPADGTMTMTNLPSSGEIMIYDLRGQRVWDDSWVSGVTRTWDGRNYAGTMVASGRYFVLIRDGSGRVQEKRVILVVN